MVRFDWHHPSSGCRLDIQVLHDESFSNSPHDEVSANEDHERCMPLTAFHTKRHGNGLLDEPGNVTTLGGQGFFFT